MIGMERRSSSDEQHQSSPYSWWWDSRHYRPPHSQRLHSDLQELEKKIKMIIELTEDNGDTFAERADMYYQKRPQLIKLLQELYASYRSLADKYDHLLKSESSFKPPTNPGSASNSSISSLQKGKPNPHCTSTASSEEAPSSLSESDQHLATRTSALLNSGDRDTGGGGGGGGNCVETEAAGNNVDDATKFSRLLEEILSQQAELMRRNDEKRATIVELRNEIKILKSDPRKHKKRMMRGLFCMP